MLWMRFFSYKSMKANDRFVSVHYSLPRYPYPYHYAIPLPLRPVYLCVRVCVCPSQLIAEACLLLAAKMGEVRLAKDKRDYPDLIVSAR